MPGERPLFVNAFHAGAFLLGLAAFWFGFLVIGVMLLARDPHLGRGAQIGGAELAAILLTLGGGLLVSGAQMLSLFRLGGLRGMVGGPLMMTTTLRLVMPATLSTAARTLGLNGPVVASALYLVLLAGVFAFFGSFLLR